MGEVAWIAIGLKWIGISSIVRGAGKTTYFGKKEQERREGTEKSNTKSKNPKDKSGKQADTMHTWTRSMRERLGPKPAPNVYMQARESTRRPTLPEREPTIRTGITRSSQRDG